MAFGLYKPGQGYWMRVVTAAMIGTLFLAMAMWVAGQAKTVVATLPKTSYSMLLRANATGTPPAPGTRLVLLGAAQSSTAEAPILGNAIVQSYDADNRRLVFRNVQITNTNYDVSAVEEVRVEGNAGEAPVYAARGDDQPRGLTVIEPILVQGITASIILIIGAVITYWVCAIRPKTVDFLINTDMEMKKVNWSTRKDIIGSTWVVIGSAFLIAAFIFSTDFVMQWFFKTIGVLHT